MIIKRLAAILYDSLLILAIYIISTLILVLINQGRAIPTGSLAFQLFLIFLNCLFFVYFWTHNGQTAGMLAWRLKVVDIEGNPISYMRALLRYGCACFGFLIFGL